MIRDAWLWLVWRVQWLARHVARRRVRRHVRELSERLAAGQRVTPRSRYLCSSCATRTARYVARDNVPYFGHLCSECFEECTTLEREHYAEIR